MRSARVRTPFDSAVELDDLLEESRAHALRYERPGSAALSRSRLRQRIKKSETRFSSGNPADRSLNPLRADPVPPRPGDSRRPADRGASAGLVPRAAVPGLIHRPRLPIASG